LSFERNLQKGSPEQGNSPLYILRGEHHQFFSKDFGPSSSTCWDNLFLCGNFESSCGRKREERENKNRFKRGIPSDPLF
jgi:hypothetical protein